MPIANVLAERYATKPIKRIFSKRSHLLAEREFWIAVMKAQKELGLDISGEDIAKYEAAKGDIDIDRINEIERRTRHDLKAKIEAFNEVAGVENGRIHLGMTSRDLTDNIEMIQARNAARIIHGKYVSVVRHLLDRAAEYGHIELVARTHHQAAQPTLLGRRFAMWAEELLEHLEPLGPYINNYPLRGIKGPVGTQSDMVRLLGSGEKVIALEGKIAEKFGFSRVLQATGQVYPRSIDVTLTDRLLEVAMACSNFANGMRHMAGYELVTEGFKEGQVGSSAMPHKMNTRTSERIYGAVNLLRMYAMGIGLIGGDQWEEGDVSCSIGRRVILPDRMYTSDCVCEATLTVLNEMGAYPAMLEKEVDRYLPFLATTQILMEAVEAGMGREEGHEIIKGYAVAEALRMRKGYDPELAQKLGADERFTSRGIDEARINEILADKKAFLGRANEQVLDIARRAKPLLDKYAREAKYEPKSIL
jgi:adenylosuccinate lyase